MTNNTIIPERIAQKKTGKTWINTYVDTCPETVYKALSHDLIAKKIECMNNNYGMSCDMLTYTFKYKQGN